MLETHAAMTNHKDFPKAIIKRNNEMVKGELDMLYNCSNIADIVRQDKRPIYFVRTMQVTAPVEEVQRYETHNGKQLSVKCPNVYNIYMGDTDKNDQMTRRQKCRCHYKWPTCLMKIFIWAAYNT